MIEIPVNYRDFLSLVMNFLGHLFFSPDDDELRIANLFGDFVKGSDLSEFPQKVQDGIHLHRSIDNYIDHHQKVISLLHELYPKLPKISGIAVDLYFDHLLAINWKDYHKESLRSFTTRVYKSFNHLPEFYPLDFRYVLSKMAHEDWLYQYRLFSGLEMASKGLSKRIRFENKLADAPSVYLEFHEKIEKVFREYMMDGMEHFKISHI